MLGFRIRPQDLGVLGMKRAGDHNVLPAGVRHRHRGRLGQRGGAVIHRGVGDVEPGEQRDHALKLVDRLQRALTRLSLIRRVGRVEVGPRDHLVDDRRTEPSRGAGAEKAVRRSDALVEPSELAEILDQLDLG